MVTIPLLRKADIFKRLSDVQLYQLMLIAHERNSNEGTMVFVQGNGANILHICGSGKVDIIVKINEPHIEEIRIQTVTEGMVFGWSALLEPYIYSSSAKCAEKTQDIFFNSFDLFNLFNRDTHTGYIVMRNLSAIVNSRLVETNQKLSSHIPGEEVTYFSRSY